MSKSIVSIIRSTPSNVNKDINHLIRSAEIDRFLDKKNTTIIKDNISWHFPYLSANTTPWQLEGTISGLKENGFENLVAVHNNTVVTDPFKGSTLNKLDQIYRHYNIIEKYNFKPEDIQWKIYKPKSSMRVLNRIYPEGIRIPDYFHNKNIVHLPTVKCHIYTTTTGSMKNAFGGLLNTKRHYTHTHIHETLVDLLAIQKEIHSGIFTVMDGSFFGKGPGPRTMIPVENGTFLASADSVAIDAVAAKMMGFDPMEIPYIRYAHEDGLGIGKLDEIEIVGGDIEEYSYKFDVGNNMASNIGKLLWFGPLKRFQKIFFHTPIVKLFVFGSFFYHDYLWWPFIGKKIMETLRENTTWGKYFETYQVGKQ